MIRFNNLLVGPVARLPVRVQTKLLIAFLAIAALLIALGAVGLYTLSGVNQRTEELIRSERKIAAYRQVQHDTTSQLYCGPAGLRRTHLGQRAAPAQPVRLRPRAAAVRRQGRDQTARQSARGVRPLYRRRDAGRRADPRRACRGGAGGAAERGAPVGKPARAPDQRARQQSRGGRRGW